MVFYPGPRIQLTSTTTPHPPADLGAPFAALGLLAGAIMGHFFPEYEWGVFAAIALVGGAVGFRLHRKQRRQIAEGEYRVGTVIVFGSCYLLWLGILLVLFGVAFAKTYEPGLSFFGPDDSFGSVATQLAEMLGVLFLVPLALGGLWLLPAGFVVGSAAEAGQVPLAAPLRAFRERATWGSVSGVTAVFSLLAWPTQGAGLLAAAMRPGPLLALAALALAALLLVADAAGRARLAAFPEASAGDLEASKKALRASLAVTATAFVCVLVHAFIARG